MRLSLETVMEACERDDCTGFCTRCGHEQGNCEPDMRQGRCENCKEQAVYGAEEILLQFS